MNKIFFHLSVIFKQLWFRCCLYCLFALFAFFITPFLGPIIPSFLEEIVSVDAVTNLLKIIASSMLAVTTFSLSIMVQALSVAATTATPRANKLLLENRTAQNALGAFIGSFLFSIVGIIGISAKFYTKDIIVVLFLFTLVMIALVVVMLLRWIDQLSKLGRVSITIDLVEKALEEAIQSRAGEPFVNTHSFEYKKEKFQDMQEIVFDEVGYVQYVDIAQLQEIAEDEKIKIYVIANPGVFLDGIKPQAFIDKEGDEVLFKKIKSCFVIGDDRTYQHDPRYGFVVLSEIALRALSPAVNDPGTAIDIINTYVRSLKKWNHVFYRKKSDKEKIKYDRIYITPLLEKDVLEDMFGELVSLAAKHFSVAMRLKKALLSVKEFSEHQLSKEVDYWIQSLEARCEEVLVQDDVKKIKA